MKKKNTAIAALVLIAALGLSACGDRSQPADQGQSAAPTSPALQQVFDAKVGDVPLAIPAAKESAKAGDTITIKGRVMGSAQPFVEGRSLFLIGDGELLTPCNEVPGDNCPTPWDTCCDDPEDVKKGTATIQVVDAEGKVLQERIRQVNGLDHLSTVVVTGQVATTDNGTLVLNASAIQVTP